MDTLQALIASLSALLVLGIALYSAAHALLNKRDTRAVIAWVGLIMLLPLGGSILYWLLGVNRIKSRARALREAAGHPQAPLPRTVVPAPIDERWQPLVRAGDALSPFPYTGGNRLEPLVNGETAYPAMLEAINGAKHSVALATYIFDHDPTGKEFRDALIRAHERGVAVRVLIDGVGVRYSRRSMQRALRRAGVPARLFLPMHLPRTLAAFNLRNHRKLLVVDGHTGFTGGMNLRAGHRIDLDVRHPVQDLHFQVRGPVVAQMQRVFTDDWRFATGETLQGDDWFPPLPSAGDVPARGVPDGPDEHFETLRQLMLAALAEARESITVMTPYFLPDGSLISALNSAALRGLKVDILLPARGNLPLVQWASEAMHWMVLERGCRIWLTPPPFDHSKLLLVDGEWVLLGSANWDPRSLRLNFEFNLECLDPALGRQMQDWVEARKREARALTLEESQRRSLPVRLRNGAARLLTPYL
ncbi:phospholipase D/Transphosphatidylase [Thioalkalivibrio sulfidiphilus HL-EbGr7]|uniref:Phospholipase D/Transphosphatidylase n=1 Tax=Thioalkalivibrio sulfidiphilus (strain HL-EbGR7) TaxID=396588 RepID=B8GT28_THISH|nr:phospholipase D-like domain-containing protein [Thioalkalivibrio sulfidiphilus]ACL73043.1 phospholipase D/Transphosphatidylase [Thioalkalivibrio sulfidiphilus HL-EbGr7]